MTEFYPSAAAIPATLDTPDFVLEPLTTDHATLDYAAVMASKDYLRMWSSSDWPADDFMVDDNRADLQGHQDEHEAAQAFTYTVLSPDESRCLGCVYIEPNTVDLLTPEDFDALVRFWVTPEAVAGELDAQLLAGLRDWLRTESSFGRVFYHTNLDDAHQQTLFEEAGLVRIADVEIPRRNGRYVVFGGALAADLAPDSVLGADVVDGLDLGTMGTVGEADRAPGPESL